MKIESLREQYCGRINPYRVWLATLYQ